jgi:hypothetical protein
MQEDIHDSPKQVASTFGPGKKPGACGSALIDGGAAHMKENHAEAE